MAISIISDVTVPSTDTNALAAELRAGARAEPTKPTTTSTKTDTTSTEPRRFAGKSREEVMEMYLNLESHSGRLANELGQTQRAVQELIIDKRARDLRANGVEKPTTVDPAELLQRPTEALDPFIEERVTRAVNPIREQLTRLENMLGQSVFNSHHSDANDVTSTPEFKAWVTATPLRRSIASMAANGNTQAADELLTEFKNTQKAESRTAADVETRRLAEAASVSLEQSRTGNDGTAVKQGKTYTRAQMLALMQSAAYQSDELLREEVSKAYIEGRVR